MYRSAPAVRSEGFQVSSEAIFLIVPLERDNLPWTMASSGSNKRQRHGGGERSPSNVNNPMLQLTDFPDALLVRSAEYLSNTSCVSFAMALNPQMMSRQPSDLSTAISRASRENWEHIDLKDIQDIRGRSLTDDDVRWILLAIDAVNNVKSLKVTNCVGITGAGLEPLRGSTVLERIDLSLVGDHENPTINPEPPISVSTIVPILDSIIGAEGNSLVHVQLPKKWREERSNILTQFLQRFDTKLNDRRLECSKHPAEICEGSDEYELALVYWQDDDVCYGMTGLTCYECKNNFCLSCYENGNFNICRICEKWYCEDCKIVAHCQGGNCSTSYQPSSCEICDVMKNW